MNRIDRIKEDIHTTISMGHAIDATNRLLTGVCDYPLTRLSTHVVAVDCLLYRSVVLLDNNDGCNFAVHAFSHRVCLFRVVILRHTSFWKVVNILKDWSLFQNAS